MGMDDDLTADEGGSRDGIDDFLDENYKRTTERQADSNVINRAFNYLTKQRGGINEVGFPKSEDYCLDCKQCQEVCQNCYNRDLLEVSTQAALQAGVIVGVCILCIILYIIMLYLEKLYDRMFNPEKNKAKPW